MLPPSGPTEPEDVVLAEQQHQESGGARHVWRRWKRSRWKSAVRYAMMARMDSPTFGVQATVAGVDLPAEWQALLAHQAAVLVALLSRMQTAVAAMRWRQAPAARLQALSTEAERVLAAQAQAHLLRRSARCRRFRNSRT
jgi:hypothetical protein